MTHATGVHFPSVDGRRPTSPVGQEILARSVAGVDEGLAADIRADGQWRSGYPRYYERVLVAEAGSTAAAFQVARQGLRAATELFVVVDSDGVDQPLATAAASPGEFDTVAIAGADERVRELVVPYRGESLRGLALLRTLDDWVHRGITEPSFADAIAAVVRNPDWLDLRDRTIAMVGAGSEMGPFIPLMSWGATVAAVDLPRPGIWRRLIEQARESAGRLLVPVRAGGEQDTPTDPAARAGADLFTDVGPVLRWLTEQPGPLTIGNYGYADGAAFVRLTMAFDVLFTELSRSRTDLSVAYLATPADVFLVPIRAVDMAQRRHAEQTPLVWGGKVVHALSRGKWFKPNYSTGNVIETPTERFGYVNWFIPEQGPNYALAKRLQRWRMIQARAAGILTSVHVAPPTRTRSVHSNPAMRENQILTGLVGVETFDAATSEALAAAILVHDLRNPSSPANPVTPLGHPHEAFMFAANPGGRWRVPFDVGSTVPLLHDLRVLGPGLLNGARTGIGRARQRATSWRR